MPEHASASETNVRLTLQNQLAGQIKNTEIVWDNPDFDKDASTRNDRWLYVEIPHFGGWDKNDPTLFQIQVLGKLSDDPYGIALDRLRDKVIDAMDVENGMVLKDYRSDPHNPTEIPGFNLHARHGETAKMENTIGGIKGYLVPFEIHHWRLKRSY